MGNVQSASVVRATLLGVGVLLSVLPGPSRADYASSFREGLRAVDFKDWQSAEMLMRNAISQQPAGVVGTSLRIYGTRFERYLPYYYLGLARYRQGDCRGTLEAIRQARAASAIGGVQRGKLRIYEEVCRLRLGLPQRQIAQTQPGATPPVSGYRAGSSMGVPRSSRGPGRPSSDPGPSNRPPSAPRTSPPSRTPLGSVDDVHRQQLDKVAAQTEKELGRGEALAGSLETRRKAGAGAFQRDPGLSQTLVASRRLLTEARFLFEASRREGDLAGVERARDEAQAATEELEEVVRVVGR